MISNEYRKLNESLHASSSSYGTSGENYSGEIAEIAFKFNTTDILDYGCGKSTLAHQLPFMINQYDPAIPKFNYNPEPADIVVCTDVMEHIEPEFCEKVILHIHNLTKKLAYLSISIIEAKKTLDDGRNAHINLKSWIEWLALISKYFDLLSEKSLMTQDGRIATINLILRPKGKTC